MTINGKSASAFVVALGLLTAASAQAQVRLPRLVSDGIVLQREVPVRVWGFKLTASGPLYQSLKTTGHKATLTFSAVGRGLLAKGGAQLGGFTVAGPDYKFVAARLPASTFRTDDF